MKRNILSFTALLLALLIGLCACEKDMQVEESAPDGLQTYQLPTEWKVTKSGGTLRYTVSYEGGSVTVTREGKVLQNVTHLRFTVDEAGNVVSREETNGSRLEAVYDADGRLTATLLRDRRGVLQQRTEYDENGRAVRVYSRASADEVILWEYTYGGDGELLTEATYDSCKSRTYEYHANGQVAAENVYLMDTILYCRMEYDENGRPTWKYEYDEDGTVSFRYEYDEQGGIVAKYDAEGNQHVNYREQYDENGNLTEYRSLGDDGVLVWWEVYGYDENGNQVTRRRCDGGGWLLEEEFMTYDGSGVLTVTEERVYGFDYELSDVLETQWNEDGNPIQETRYDRSGNVRRRTVYTYQDDGKSLSLETLFFYNSEGKLEQRQEKTYDGSGNPTVELAYDEDGALLGSTERTYDERGNLLEYINRNGDGDVTDREEWTYDEQNNLREQIRYNRDGSVFARWVYDYTYTYDDANRLVSSTYATPGSRWDYTYESGSGLRRETIRDEDGNVLYTYETVYDNNGNPRIRQSNKVRTEYEWSPEGGLISCVRYGAGKEVLSRLEAGKYIACALTESQYRRILELLLAATGASDSTD